MKRAGRTLREERSEDEMKVWGGRRRKGRDPWKNVAGWKKDLSAVLRVPASFIKL